MRPLERVVVDEWPPYPSVILGAGRWRRIVTVLRATGTKADAALAGQIERQAGEVYRVADG